MLDFHTHILPRIDDGARSSDMSLEMLRAEKNDGVSDIILTPHFYYERYAESGIDGFLYERQASYDRLRSRLTGGEPRLRLGAEVAFTRSLLELPDIEKLCIEGTDYLLLELPYNRIGDAVMNSLMSFLLCGRFTPVIAHIERHRSALSKEQLSLLLDAGVAMQCNFGSLFNLLDRRWIIDMIRSGNVRFMGSDCHNLTTRPPNCGAGMALLKKKAPDAAAILADSEGRFMAGE